MTLILSSSDAHPEAGSLPTDVLMFRQQATLAQRLAGATTVPSVLAAVTELAPHLVPGSAAASLTVLREGAAAVVAASHPHAQHVDEAQFREGQGPYLQAVRLQRPVCIDDIRSGPADAAWARAAIEAGFRGVLTVPVATAADTVATFSLYTRSLDGWTETSLIAAAELARLAGHGITVAQGGPVAG
jgi:GAF domain-containing protein